MPAFSSAEVEVPLEVRAFTEYAMAAGWGDGLPLVPPSPTLVESYITASGRPAGELLAELPPKRGRCTVEKLAINAAMAGAPEESMPLLRAAIQAMADPNFDLAAINATTGAAVPAVIVNGEVRHRIGIPFADGCFGGAEGAGPAVGRALRLVIRNVGGQRVGQTSRSVFGQPGRVCGIVVGEWEERSPWAPLGQRRGVDGDAVTVFATQGTADLCDLIADRGAVLLEVLGKSLACPATNAYLTSVRKPEVVLALCPPWAELIARDVPAVEDVQQLLWNAAKLPLSWWPSAYHGPLEATGRVTRDGEIHVVEDAADVLVIVNGGLGSIHATALHSWGNTRSITVAIGSGNDGVAGT
jgi:hypothetical protein